MSFCHVQSVPDIAVKDLLTL